MDEKNRGLQWSHIEPYCLVRTLLRQLWMLLLAAAACAMAAWIVLSCFVTRQYTSSTTFAVTARASTLYYTNITAAADMAASYSQLLQSRVLRQTMEQNLGMSLDGTVSAQQLGETNLIRVTVTAEVDEVPLEQIIKQLNKLLHVLKIVDLDPETTVERELVLIKVAADESNRSDVLEIVRLFRVRVVDVNPESLTIEATGAEGKIDALLGLLEHYGIIELVRSGAVAVTRGPKALSEKVLGSEITGR